MLRSVIIAAILITASAPSLRAENMIIVEGGQSKGKIIVLPQEKQQARRENMELYEARKKREAEAVKQISRERTERKELELKQKELELKKQELEVRVEEKRLEKEKAEAEAEKKSAPSVQIVQPYPYPGIIYPHGFVPQRRIYRRHRAPGVHIYGATDFGTGGGTSMYFNYRSNPYCGGVRTYRERQLNPSVPITRRYGEYSD